MATRLIRSMQCISPSQQGGVVTIGNFDGVHLGHQQLIASVVAQAAEWNVPSLVMTFEPHPFEFFNKKQQIIRLTTFKEKFIELAKCAVDNVVILRFNRALAEKPAASFVLNLYQALRPKHIVIGDDFHFGYKRQGNIAMLQEMGGQLGFTVSAMPTVTLKGMRVSSTRIRQALAEGDDELVKQFLGRSYPLSRRLQPVKLPKEQIVEETDANYFKTGSL